MTKRITADWQPGRVVGHLVTNETGTHLFCNWCVKADDPAYGTLHEIHINQVEAGGRCSICSRIIKWVSGAPHIERFAPKLREFYEGPIPTYVVDAGKTYMIVTVSDFTGKRNLKITINDYLVYRFSSWGVSGIRTIAGHEGDWRQIDNLVEEVFRWFQFIDTSRLKREIRKTGLLVWF